MPLPHCAGTERSTVQEAAAGDGMKPAEPTRGGSTAPVSATAFEFISSRAQIRLIHAFMDSLPERLR